MLNESFLNICIGVPTANVTLMSTQDDVCKVECLEREREKHAVSVEDGTLVIRSVDERKWYEYNVSMSFVSDTEAIF